MLHPNLHILTDDEHWTVTLETHKYEAAARSFCVVTTANGEQQDVYNFTLDDSSSTQVEISTGVNCRIRKMLERCVATCEKAAGAKAKMRSRARKEAPAQEVRGYYKPFARGKHCERKS